MQQLAGENSPPPRPSLLFVYPSHMTEEEAERQTTELQGEWQVQTAAAHAVHTLGEEVHHVLFWEVQQDLLVRGALGLTDTRTSHLLAQALLQAVPVTLSLSPSLRWVVGNGPWSPYQLYIRQQKEQLERFGVSVLAAPGLVELLTAPAAAGPAAFPGKLVTEADIQHITSTSLLLQPGTIVTPLAREAARSKGIVLQTEGNGG